MKYFAFGPDGNEPTIPVAARNGHTIEWLVNQMPCKYDKDIMLLCNKDAVCLPFPIEISQHFPMLCRFTRIDDNLWGTIPIVTPGTKQYCNCGMVTINWETGHEHKKNCMGHNPESDLSD